MSSSSNRSDDPGVMEVAGKVLVATVIALFVVLVLVVVFHIYATWLWHRRRQSIDGHNSLRRRQNHHSGVTVLRRGLDASFLKTIPVIQFDSKKGSLECSVCLSEVEDGEKTRILPKCNHGFHAECIDMWFHSHSTCPICRNSVSEQIEISVESSPENHQTQEHPTTADGRDSHTFPTSVLLTEVSTLTSRLEEADNHHQEPSALHFEPPSSSSSASASASSSSQQTNNERRKPDLVIDVSRSRDDNGDDDEKTPVTSAGMRSIMRILSSRRFNPFSPRNVNNVQGQSLS